MRLWPPPTGRQGWALPTGTDALLVIGLIGGEETGPFAVANRLADLPAFPLHGSGSGTASVDEAEAELLMHVDQEHGVGYIVLSSPSCGARLLERASVLSEHASAMEVHTWLADSASERAMLVLFHLCHVVLLVSNARCADVRLLRTLRVLATVKQSLQAACAAALKPMASHVASQMPRPSKDQPPLLPPVAALGFVFAPRAGTASPPLQPALESQVRRLLSTSRLLARAAKSDSPVRQASERSNLSPPLWRDRRCPTEDAEAPRSLLSLSLCLSCGRARSTRCLASRRRFDDLPMTS